MRFVEPLMLLNLAQFVCGSVWQCVAVRCNALQYLHELHSTLNVVALQTHYQRHLRGASPDLLGGVENTLHTQQCH